MTHRTDSHPAGAHCAKCGAQAPSGAAFCPYCAAPVPPGGPPPPDPRGGGRGAGSEWAIALLPAFTGLAALATLLAAGRLAGPAGWIVALAALACLLAFLVRDVGEMKRGLNAAHAQKEISAPLWVLGGAAFPPAYLFRRASHTDGRYGPFIANTVIVLATICAHLIAEFLSSR